MLIPAQHVVAFRRGPKNDRNDAAAIAEAARRPCLRTVPINILDQQDIQTSLSPDIQEIAAAIRRGEFDV